MANKTCNAIALLEHYGNFILENEGIELEAFLKDQTIIQFLSYCLSGTNEKEVLLSLAVLEKLLERKKIAKIISTELGVIPALQCVLRNYLPDAPSYEKAIRILKIIEDYKTTLHQSIHGDTTARTIMRPNVYRTITLNLKHQISENQRKVIEAGLVKIEGVISIVIDPSTGKCCVRVKSNVQPSVLTMQVAESLKLYREQRNAQKEEKTKRRMSILPSFREQYQDVDLPEYLPEADDDVKGNSVASSGVFNKVAPMGWITTASDFLRKSFYW